MNTPPVRKITPIENSLRENLVGEVLPRKITSIVGSWVVESETRVPELMEDITATLVRRLNRGVKVSQEPNGKNTFPDIAVQYSAHDVLQLEIKTHNSVSKNPVTLADFSGVVTRIMKGDASYLQTWWLIWQYREVPRGYQITDLQVEQFHRLVGITEEGLVELRSNSGRPRILTGDRQSEIPDQLLYALKKTMQKMSYPAEELEAFTYGSTVVLHKLSQL